MSGVSGAGRLDHRTGASPSPRSRAGRRRLLRALLGARRPQTHGTRRVDGVTAPLEILRDSHGVPTVLASSDADAAVGLGFCHGQDRGFQLETLARVVRGELAALIGGEGVAIDRLSRRVGFARDTDAALAQTAPRNRAWVEGYTAGINAALAATPRPHELALLRAEPTRWQPGDVVAVGRLLAFLMPGNWDQELARLAILTADGSEAVVTLDGAYPAEAPAHDRPGVPAGALVDGLARDLEAFARTVGLGGGSNAWALAGARTASGRPVLASDPHLRPQVPAHWYLAHVHAPDGAVAGASLVGAGLVLAGHNGHGAWGPTVAPVDTSDFFLEDIDADGARRGDRREPVATRTEVIEVRGADPVEIEVRETSHGPVLTPELAGVEQAVALRAGWLAPHPLDAFDLHRARSLDDVRAAFADWAGATLNLVWADTSGTIGWQVVGRAPRRRGGHHGTVPAAGWDPEAGWEPEGVPTAELPGVTDPPGGFVVSANHLPTADPEAPWLGRDWLDPDRARRIEMVLSRRHDWDADGCGALQRDVTTLAWWDLRDHVLAATPTTHDARIGWDLLAQWGGQVRAGSPAATVFELLAAELWQRLVAAVAPRAARWASGAGMTALLPGSYFPKLRYRRLVQLAREDGGPFAGRWDDEIADALGAVVRRLRAAHGPDPRDWAWGRVRSWHVPHAFGGRRPLSWLFDLGPLPGEGDLTTPAQHGVDAADPTAVPTVHPSLRAVIDVGDWAASRFALPGGQSGNPASPHYDDQLPAYLAGGGVTVAWGEAEARARARAELRLTPRG